MRASQGGCMFPCSLWKFTVFPLFLKNKLRCFPQFTFTEFSCSQKFRSIFPRSPKNIPHYSLRFLSYFIFSRLVIFIGFNEKWEKLKYFANILSSERPFSVLHVKKAFSNHMHEINVPLFPIITQQFPCSLKVILRNTLFPKSKWSCSLVL